jgi:hypothetical protein
VFSWLQGTVCSKMKYKAGYKYQLVEHYERFTDVRPWRMVLTDYLLLDKQGRLSIKCGYAWDGPSGPTFDTPDFMEGSLIHDALYQLIRMGLLPRSVRKEADQELRDICLENGMSRFRAWCVYVAVRLFGAFAASPKSVKRVYGV